MTDENVKKEIHILLGICNLDEVIVKRFKDEFESRDLIVHCASKFQKSGIELYIIDNPNVDAVIVSEYLQKSSPYSIADFDKLKDINNDVMIIPILENEKKKTSFMSELLNIGIYTALFEKDASVPELVDMVIKGRTRKEAKYYYGIETTTDIGTFANIISCVDYIVLEGPKENTKERADYVKARISSKDFEVVMSKLPKDIQDRLRIYEEYAPYFESADGKTNEKRNIIPSKLLALKNILTEDQNEVEPQVVVKQEIQSAVKKVVLGFAGVQSRVGTTHQTILFANYLNRAGYKVAVIENSLNESKSLCSIEKMMKVKQEGDHFNYLDVDYYPNYDLSYLSRIYLKDYNFVLIDFGQYNELIANEFGRCVVRIIITGCKPWEVSMLERLMLVVGNEDVLKTFCYLFVSAPENEKKAIIKNMDVLNKVFFAGYQADPFSSEGYEAIKEILNDYLPVENIRRKGFINKIQQLFE